MRGLFMICVLLHYSVTGSAIDTLHLSIDSLALVKLNDMREGAMNSGLILKKHKKKVSAVFNSGKRNLKAKIRLKGDWLDHVDTDKWSFRIELNNGHYHGMQRFSIQHPRTRGYLTEYEIHKLLEQQGVMTTKYDFAVVYINDENKGIYAVEEHFDFPMLDRLDHREAPILKFNETVFWEFQHLRGVSFKKSKSWNPINVEYPVFENAEISTFRKKKIRKSIALADQFLKGRDMLHALRIDDYERLSDLIDLESFASFYAVSDVIGMHHGLRWHNMRFYVDPILNKLKPIAFDVWQIKSGLNRPILGARQERSDTIYFADIFFRDKFLNDDEFRSIYFEKLSELSRSAFDFVKFLSKDSTLSHYRELLRHEFPNIDVGGVKMNEAVTMDLDSVKTAFQPFQYYPYRVWKTFNPEIVKKYARPMPEQPIKGLGLKAYRESLVGGKQTLTLINKDILDLELIGFSSKSKSQKIQFLVNPLIEDSLVYLKIEVDTGFTKIAFRVPGDTLVHQSKISRYRYFDSVDFVGPTNKAIGETSLSGKTRIDEMIQISENQSLVIDPGSEISFGRNGGIFCEGNLSCNGSIEEPVVFRSDSTFLGILAVGATTSFSSTQFDGLQLDPDQIATGAVTISDSELKMDDCTFNAIKAEDALNGIRVNASISRVSFSNCSSDALDLDFSNFEINQLSVTNTGNDGLDLSGSAGKLEGSFLTQVGDKAVSCGEGSQVLITSTTMDQAQIGIAAKDGSQVKLDTCSISNCDVGVWAFRKKRHFDGGVAQLKGTHFENVKIQTQFDGFSVIQK
jgi:hypothetical protein